MGDKTDVCMKIAIQKANERMAACSSNDSTVVKNYYGPVCWFQVSTYHFNTFWIIALTILLIIFTIYQIVKASKTKDKFSWLNFNQSIFYRMLPDYHVVWRFLLFLTISLGYFYWIPIESVLQAQLFEKIINDPNNPDLNNPNPAIILLIQLIGTVTEFFYFWITFLVTLMLGTRWEYTVLNLSEHVSKEDRVSMLKYMLKKSVIFSGVFTGIRIGLVRALTNNKEINYTYNNVVINEFSFRVYRFLRAAFILTYAYQRYVNYSGRFSKLVSGKKNEITEMEVRYRLQKHEKDILSSESKLLSVLKNTKDYDSTQKEAFLSKVQNNLRGYFTMHKQELHESIQTIVKQDAITIPRNPKETPLIGGIYLFFMIASNAFYAFFVLANELCNFAMGGCNCRGVRFSLELVAFTNQIFDLVCISFIIQILLNVGGLFEDAIELKADDEES